MHRRYARPGCVSRVAMLGVSRLFRNVPVLNSLEMSPWSIRTMPVEARGKLSCSFPRSGGRVLFASTAPSASTGVSRIHRRIRFAIGVELLLDPELLDHP